MIWSYFRTLSDAAKSYKLKCLSVPDLKKKNKKLSTTELNVDWIYDNKNIWAYENSEIKNVKKYIFYLSQKIDSDKSCCFHVALRCSDKNGPSVFFLPKTHNSSLIVRKASNSNWRLFYKITSTPSKTRKD